MNFAKQIRTERLLLRSLRKRDFWFFYKILGSACVRLYLGGPVPRRQRFPRFKRYLTCPSNTGVWVVSLTERNQSIGLVELGLHKDGKDYEISYQFAPDFWGMGFATEAIREVVRHALDEAGLRRIIAETQGANSASCRLLRELGMVEVERVQRFGAEQIIFATDQRPPLP
ncbi:GNAT family N-acetyltransferase [uncultured Tateyamaria sp.]|uniref:GNAT family N-acetyltransferase n=1 Tax=uncultured Tateyamaria sp. TaxID=455651 RepID=UPI0026358554|nr:GNAT family N-acetyltransferase [uncultured Tateyamaria sp.]